MSSKLREMGCRKAVGFANLRGLDKTEIMWYNPVIKETTQNECVESWWERRML